MFFKRIGAKKCKFTVNIYLKQLSITLEEKQYVKLYLTRGEHHAETDKPEKVRKGVCNLNRQKLSIECTMFFDPDKNEYLEKMAELKIKECDKDGSNSKTVGKVEFDLAEYLNMEEAVLAIEFEFDKVQAKLEADIEFLRNYEAATEMDDKRSAASEETIKSARTQGHQKKTEPLKEDPKKMKKQLPKIEEAEQPPAVEPKATRSKKPALGKEAEKANEDPLRNRLPEKPRPEVPNQEGEPSSDRKERNSGETVKYSDRFTKPSQRQAAKSKDPKEQKSQNLPITNRSAADQKVKTSKRDNIGFQMYDKPDKIEKTDKQKPKDKANTDVTVFLLKKQLEQKNREIQNLRNENSRLMQVIDRLSKQSLPVRTESIIRQQKLEQQNKSLKSKLVQKEIQQGKLQVQLRSGKQRQQRLQQSLKRETKDYEYVRQQLQQSKNKIAELLQSCFELGDADLISFVQRHLDLE